jgi:hypothetical protein
VPKARTAGVHRAWALASTILHSFPIVEGSFDCLKISGRVS